MRPDAGESGGRGDRARHRVAAASGITPPLALPLPAVAAAPHAAVAASAAAPPPPLLTLSSLLLRFRWLRTEGKHAPWVVRRPGGRVSCACVRKGRQNRGEEEQRRLPRKKRGRRQTSKAAPSTRRTGGQAAARAEAAPLGRVQGSCQGSRGTVERGVPARGASQCSPRLPS